MNVIGASSTVIVNGGIVRLIGVASMIELIAVILALDENNEREIPDVFFTGPTSEIIKPCALGRLLGLSPVLIVIAVHYFIF